MNNISFDEIVTLPYIEGAIIREDFPGFKEDYLVLHCLIKKYTPQTFFEIGTSTGLGTKVICNAMGLQQNDSGTGRKVFSIDVPPGTDPKITYPEGEDGHPDTAGVFCDLPYVQVFGNTCNFDFSPYYPIEGWFIDGKHDYQHVKNDTEQALKSNPLIIVWHDMQIQGVSDAVMTVMEHDDRYSLFQAADTRMAFTVKKGE